jgi:hypothetical protein
MQFVRDNAMTALFFGFFASSWFGWAQQKPPASWVRYLALGSVLGLATAVTGGIVAALHWSDGSALSEPGAMRRYGIIVGIEFAVAAIGVGVLAWRKLAEYMPTWVCLVVGVHFWPMAPVLQNPGSYVVGALLCVVAVGGVLVARRRSVPISFATGIGAGVTLLVFAAIGLVAALV